MKQYIYYGIRDGQKIYCYECFLAIPFLPSGKVRWEARYRVRKRVLKCHNMFYNSESGQQINVFAGDSPHLILKHN
jgi:hypothetical protein